MKFDVIVLGAGMVGVSAALALQSRGRNVILVDRRGAAEETSFGNAGLIQREGVVPYSFPQDWKTILTSAINSGTRSHLHWGALPYIAPQLYRYWRNGTRDGVAKSAAAMGPLVERSIDEHSTLIKAANAGHLVRRTGYLKIFRDRKVLDEELVLDDAARRRWGVVSDFKTGAEVRELEPNLKIGIAGGILMPQPWSVSDPSALGKAYASLFTSRGGHFSTGDASLIEPYDGGWRLPRVEGAIEAAECVIALGPWSDALLRKFGVRLPFFVKRGYHMHYQPVGNAVPARPIVDGDYGFLITPMTRGIRLTTGAEFAQHGSAATPVQLGKVEPLARQLFPLGARADQQPWLGARPCLPDLVPAIGAVPGKRGLWLDSGHQHLGFTLGPVSGRLLAEMMTRAEPFTDPAPYSVDRFGFAGTR